MRSLTGPRVARSLALVLLATATASCAPPPRALRWEVVGGEPRRDAVRSWRAVVSEGPCLWSGSTPSEPSMDAGALDAGALDGGPLAYDRSADALGALGAPPELGPGRWSFHVVGSDETGRVLTAGCTTETLPLPRDARVTVRLEPAYLAPAGSLADTRFCRAWAEVGCRDGDDDCDGVADCLDGDCQGSAECACTSDADCGECATCDRSVGVCRAREDAASCASGAGRCHGAVCCTGCFADGVCAPGDAAGACGARGVACVACDCGCVDGECAPCMCDDVFRCAHGECRDRRCCAPGAAPPAEVTVTVGRGYACASDSFAGVRCFGEGSRGQLGLGDTSDGAGWLLCPGFAGPCAVGPWDLVSAGTTHTCGVRDSTAGFRKRLACWGDNRAGQLGNGGASPEVAPTWVQNSSSSGFTSAHVLGVDVGDAFTCAVVSEHLGHDAGGRDAGLDGGLGESEGSVWCWGSFLEGRLLYRTSNAQAPLRLAGLPSATAVTLGRGHACSLSTRGEVHCWGANLFGQAGETPSAAVQVPAAVRAGALWRAIDAGDEHTCGLLQEAGGCFVECWGANDHGQRLTRQGPYSCPDSSGAEAVRLALGAAHTCVLSGADVRCVGLGAAFGDSADASALVRPSSLPMGVVTDVAAGGNATCVVIEGRVFCAGDVQCADPAGGCPFTEVCLTPAP